MEYPSRLTQAAFPIFLYPSHKSNLWFPRSISGSSQSPGWTNFSNAAVWVMGLKLGSPQKHRTTKFASLPGSAISSAHLVYIFSLLEVWRHLHKCGFSLKSKSINLKSETNNARADTGGHLRCGPTQLPPSISQDLWTDCFMPLFLPVCVYICVCVCGFGGLGVRGEN